jgi:hypothetical protein
MEEFLVVFVLVEGKNGHSVFELVEVGVGRVVYEQHVLQMAILYYSQVLYVHPLFRLPAMRPKQAVTDELTLWVEVVEHYIRVAFVTGSEYDDFALKRQLFEEFDGKGAYVDPCVDFLSIGELDF